MKKLSIFLILFIGVIFPLSSFASSVEVAINGEYIDFDSSDGSPFIDSSGRTQVPLRAAMEKFGCKVTWDDTTQTAYASKNDTVVAVPIGQRYIVKNGIKIPNDTKAIIRDGRTYLPIRAVFEAFGAYVSWNSSLACVDVSTVSRLMQVLFLDIGQGDSSFIDFGTYEILIDAGDVGCGETVVSDIAPYVDGSLELVIATHPDSDHIGGMPEVFDAYIVDRVIGSGYSSSTKAFSRFLDAVTREGCVISDDEDETIILGNEASLKIIETGDWWENSNDMSVVCELTYGENSILFTGDISSNVEDATLWKYSDTDVLKVAHHGSSGSTSQSFLSVVKPEYAVISAGFGNKYNHPRAETLNRLYNSGTKILGTFKSKTIILNLNIEKYNFNKSDYLTEYDAGDFTPSLQINENDASQNTYTGNSNSKKFHISTCGSIAKMKEENKISFSSVDEALRRGYIPCGICKP